MALSLFLLLCNDLLDQVQSQSMRQRKTVDRGHAKNVPWVKEKGSNCSVLPTKSELEAVPTPPKRIT